VGSAGVGSVTEVLGAVSDEPELEVVLPVKITVSVTVEEQFPLAHGRTIRMVALAGAKAHLTTLGITAGRSQQVVVVVVIAVV
jgi:hypothetical protein